jgi:tetratricopeptide (TPR) repeat protein
MALFHSLDIRTALATAERAWQLAGPAAEADFDLCEMLSRARVLAGRTAEALELARAGVDGVEAGSMLAIDFGTELLYLEEYRRAREVFERVVERSRDAEAPGILNYALDQLAKLETRVANLTRAYALELECLQLTEPLGNDVGLAASLAWLGLVEAMLGRVEGRAHSERALRIAAPTRDEFNIVRARAALGLDALGRGDAAAAVEWLEPAVRRVVDGGVGLPNLFRLDPDLVEALARVGRNEGSSSRPTRPGAAGPARSRRAAERSSPRSQTCSRRSRQRSLCTTPTRAPSRARTELIRRASAPRRPAARRT